MKSNPRDRRRAKNPRKRRGKRDFMVAHLHLESYNDWHEKHAAIRQWLVKQIAERAIQIFQKRRAEP